jgi:hypothetical protein
MDEEELELDYDDYEPEAPEAELPKAIQAIDPIEAALLDVSDEDPADTDDPEYSETMVIGDAELPTDGKKVKPFSLDGYRIPKLNPVNNHPPLIPLSGPNTIPLGPRRYKSPMANPIPIRPPICWRQQQINPVIETPLRRLSVLRNVVSRTVDRVTHVLPSTGATQHGTIEDVETPPYSPLSEPPSPPPTPPRTPEPPQPASPLFQPVTLAVTSRKLAVTSKTIPSLLSLPYTNPSAQPIYNTSTLFCGDSISCRLKRMAGAGVQHRIGTYARLADDWPQLQFTAEPRYVIVQGGEETECIKELGEAIVRLLKQIRERLPGTAILFLPPYLPKVDVGTRGEIQSLFGRLSRPPMVQFMDSGAFYECVGENERVEGGPVNTGVRRLLEAVGQWKEMVEGQMSMSGNRRVLMDD